jgi:hypothetical protein
VESVHLLMLLAAMDLTLHLQALQPLAVAVVALVVVARLQMGAAGAAYLDFKAQQGQELQAKVMQDPATLLLAVAVAAKDLPLQIIRGVLAKHHQLQAQVFFMRAVVVQTFLVVVLVLAAPGQQLPYQRPVA